MTYGSHKLVTVRPFGTKHPDRSVVVLPGRGPVSPSGALVLPILEGGNS